MIKNVVILVLIFLFFINISYSQSQYKNPFEPLLPQKEVKPAGIDPDAGKVTEKAFPAIVLQGAVWGGDFPQVIIDGEVYKVGDGIKGLDAQIFKIEENTAFIFYGERVYKLKIGKREDI